MSSARDLREAAMASSIKPVDDRLALAQRQRRAERLLATRRFDDSAMTIEVVVPGERSYPESK
jgi:hypothetical protein